ALAVASGSALGALSPSVPGAASREAPGASVESPSEPGLESEGADSCCASGPRPVSVSGALFLRSAACAARDGSDENNFGSSLSSSSFPRSRLSATEYLRSNHCAPPRAQRQHLRTLVRMSEAQATSKWGREHYRPGC